MLSVSRMLTFTLTLGAMCCDSIDLSDADHDPDDRLGIGVASVMPSASAVMLGLSSCTITGMMARFWMRRYIRDFNDNERIMFV